MNTGSGEHDCHEHVEQIAAAARREGATVASCESLTSGRLSAALGAAQAATDWYCGGIVAYQSGVKHGLLRAPDGPVVTAATAEAMACSTADLLGADYSVAVTGVGGPDPQEGHPPGTVYIATSVHGEPGTVRWHHFVGGPVEVMERTVCAALEALSDQMTKQLPHRNPVDKPL